MIRFRYMAGLAIAFALVGPAVALAATDSYEPDNSAAAAKSTSLYQDVVGSGARIHTFSSSSDQDWIKFKATAWKEYSVKVYSSAVKNPDAWVRVQAFKKSGKKWVPIKSESYLGDDVAETYDFVAPASTTLWIRMRPYRKTPAVAGKRYLARVSTGFPRPTAGDAYEEADDSRAGARPLTVNPGFNSATYDADDTYRYDVSMKRGELHNIFNPIGVIDDDWYTVSVGSDAPHSILLFTGFFANRKIQMELYDAAGKRLERGVFEASEACYKRWTWNNLGSDTYYLRVFAPDSGSGVVPYWYRLGLFGP